MNDVQIIDFKNNSVRVKVDILGDPWFVLEDVCAVLGINNSQAVADRIHDDEKGHAWIMTNGGLQEMLVINEPGLYNLVLRSDKSKAQTFRKWIANFADTRKNMASAEKVDARGLILLTKFLLRLLDKLDDEILDMEVNK